MMNRLLLPHVSCLQLAAYAPIQNCLALASIMSAVILVFLILGLVLKL